MDGWIEWNGGECPVTGVDIEIKLRFGTHSQWDAEDIVYLDWEHSESDPKTDIIAYRIVGA